jgi:hypothetical protein
MRTGVSNGLYAGLNDGIEQGLYLGVNEGLEQGLYYDTQTNYEIVKNGLILYYDASISPCYPRSGLNVRDLSNNFNSGVFTNTTFNQLNNGSFVFNGLNTLITATNRNLIPVNGLTIHIFYQTGTLNRFLIDLANTTLTQGYILAHRVTPGFVFYINNRNFASNTPVLAAGTYFCLTATWQPGEFMKGYVNGVLDTTITTTIPTAITNPNVNMFIGARRNLADRFNGNIGNVLIYDRALNDSEIWQNWQSLKSRFNI